MENEQEQIKINNYDINMLIGIYFYDQVTIQLSKLAERLCAPENEVELILAEYRESPVYKDFYAEMSAFSNARLGKQDTEVLAKCMGEAAELMKAFYVLDQRKVSPATILNEGNVDKLLQSAYFEECIGKDLSVLLTSESSENQGWKRLMAETALADGYQKSMEAMQSYRDFRRSQVDGDLGEKEAEYRVFATEAYEKAQRASENYTKVFNQTFVLPEVMAMRDLYQKGDEQKLLVMVQQKRADALVIGQFVDMLCGQPQGLSADFTGTPEAISDELHKALTETAWFENMVGHDLSGIYPEMMTQAQFEMAQGYVNRICEQAGDGATVKVKAFTSKANLIEMKVNPQEIARRMDVLTGRVEERKELNGLTESFVKGESQGVSQEFFESDQFKRHYGEDLSLVGARPGVADVMVMEQYRKMLEGRISEMAADLSQNPSADRVQDYKEYESLVNQAEVASLRMDSLYADRPVQLIDLSADDLAGLKMDRTVSLLYNEHTGKMILAEAGTSLEGTEGYSVIDRFTTAKHAMDFIRLADQKMEQTHRSGLSTDNMRNEYKVFKALPANDKSLYLSMSILSNEMAQKSEHPDLAAMRQFAFEYEQKVQFDLANPGVTDVVKTDANRAKLQAKIDHDSGADRTEKVGGRSM